MYNYILTIYIIKSREYLEHKFDQLASNNVHGIVFHHYQLHFANISSHFPFNIYKLFSIG